MFQAVRQWWQGGRGKLTARLFAFELVVIIVGVLIAQGLANWVSTRNAFGQMEDSRNRIRLQLADGFAKAQAWQVAAPCLDQRMIEVMQRLSTGGLDRAQASRPIFLTFSPLDLDDSSALLLRRRYGNIEADSLAVAQVSVAYASDNIRSMVRLWGRIGLADSSQGPVTGFDRDQARLAAADIRAELRGLMNSSAEIVGYSRKLGIVPRFIEPVRAPRSCDEIWQSGATAMPR